MYWGVLLLTVVPRKMRDENAASDEASILAEGGSGEAEARESVLQESAKSLPHFDHATIGDGVSDRYAPEIMLNELSPLAGAG